MRHLVLLLLAAAACIAADPEAKDPNQGLVIDPSSYEVWTTESGTKYHVKQCPNAKVKTTLAAAVVDGDTPCAQCQPAAYDPARIAVFASGDGGKKYHLYSCRYAKTRITLAEAGKAKLAPCSVCKAPLLWAPPKPAEADAPKPSAEEKSEEEKKADEDAVIQTK